MNTNDFSTPSQNNQILRQLWLQSVVADPDHIFCKTYGVNPYELRQIDCDLLVPVKLGKNIVNLVRVNAELTLTPVLPFKAGSFFSVGLAAPISLPIYVCSNLPDSMYLHQHTGLPCVAAIWPENILAVVDLILRIFVGRQITVVSETSGKGRTYAELAALGAGTDILIPPRSIPLWVNNFSSLNLWIKELQGGR